MATAVSTTPAQKTIDALRHAYEMEIETLTNYLAQSVNLDGLRVDAVRESLAKDVTEELGHARRLAERIKQLGGLVPGSLGLEFSQNELQPTEATTDVRRVIEGVLAAEQAAIEHYRKIIRETDGKDYVTQDLCISLLGDEEAHRTEFASFLREFTSEHE